MSEVRLLVNIREVIAHGLAENETKDLQKVFPCPEDSPLEEISRHLEKEKAKERDKVTISINEKLSVDQLHSEKSSKLTETQRNLQLS